MERSRLIEKAETLVIETPERVPVEFPLASIGNRFLAVVVDHFFQILAVMLIVWLAYSVGTEAEGFEAFLSRSAGEASKWVMALMVVAVFLVFAGYFAAFEWLWNGQTPGKRILKLRVMREDGRPVTLWEALARNVLRIIDNFPGFFIPLYSVGLVAIFLNRKDQRIGDLFAGTVVVRERSGEAPTFAETFLGPSADAVYRRVHPSFHLQADLNSLTESEVEVAEVFLRRRWELGETHRKWLAWRVALPIMYKMKPEFDREGFTYEGFLEELVHRYNAKRKQID